MNKSRRYAVTVFLLSSMVVIGGWFLTKALLERKQEEFLRRTGQTALQSGETAFFSDDQPVRTHKNQLDDQQKERSGSAAGNLAEGRESGRGQDVLPAGGESGRGQGVLPAGKFLSEDMRAQVLAVWENGGNERPHEPRAGQLDMEQAMEAGKNWMTAMSEYGIVPEELAGGDFDKVTARLCTLEADVDFDENLLSYWLMQFTLNDTVVSLTVHAASGEIWKAGILTNERENLQDRMNPEELLKTAFPFMASGKREAAGRPGTAACIRMQKGLVYAEVKEQKIAVDEREPVIVMDLCLVSKSGSSAGNTAAIFH